MVRKSIQFDDFHTDIIAAIEHKDEYELRFKSDEINFSTLVREYHNSVIWKLLVVYM